MVGVDPDWADLTTYTTKVVSTDSNLNSGYWFNQSSTQFQFTDYADHDEIAETKLSKTIEIDVPEQFTNNIDLHVSSMLRGFDIDIHCNKEKQAKNNVCNSDAIWPTILNIEVSDPQIDTKSNKINLTINFHLQREWTPTRGGLKPYN